LSAHQWLVHPDVIGNTVLRELLPAVLEPTGTSSAGYPYLGRAAWTRLRDWVPHTLGSGLVAWSALDWIDHRVGELAHNGTRVARQVVRTASITAPPDLWLLRHVLSALERSGVADRLKAGLDRVPRELEPDMALLLSRGFLVKRGAGFRWSDEPLVPQIRTLPPLPEDRPTDLARRLSALLQGQPVDPTDEALWTSVLSAPLPPSQRYAPRWVATPEDLELGYRLVPLVLGLEAAHRNRAIVEAGRVLPEHLAPLSPALREGILATLYTAGWIDQEGRVSPIGSRAFQRASGPFGIIEAYHPYMSVLERIWSEGRGSVHVERAANVAASQTANRQTFAQANAALDRFCADTGFTYRVFIEHAVGKGEAIRQRVAISGGALRYVGADLEAAALAAARQEVEAGRLPRDTLFVQADIGKPELLVGELREHGLDPDGAVMIVGNGFHEIREPSDERLVEVFRGYEAAGIVVIFTEESALSVDDLLETAWNTYHAGFKYVHERSGQGLRPAIPSPTPGLGEPMPASWVECATRAGYVRLDDYSFRSRTVYPYPPVGGHNPSISATGLFVPARLAARLRFSRSA
jgi:hypothetical protein